MNGFIEQTAEDYELSYEMVAYIYKIHWPDTFYEKLEEIIKYINN